MNGEQHLRELEEKYEDYKVYDRNGERIGKVDDLFVDETDREEYIGVKMGLFGLKSTLIPMEVVRVNEAERRIEVSETKDRVKDAPTFSDDDEIDATFEENIRRHFNLESGSPEGRGSYGAYAGAAAPGGDRTSTGDAPERGTTEHGTADHGLTTGGTTEGRATRGGESEGRGYEDRGHEGTTERFGDPAGEPGSGEHRDTEEMQRQDVSGGATSPAGTSGGTPSETRDIAPGGSSGTGGEGRSEETVTEETGSGRAKVRRRIIREEIIEEDPEATQR